MTTRTPIRPSARVRTPISRTRPCMGTAIGTVLATSSRGVIVEFDHPRPGVLPEGHRGVVAAPDQLEPLTEPVPWSRLRGCHQAIKPANP